MITPRTRQYSPALYILHHTIHSTIAIIITITNITKAIYYNLIPPDDSPYPGIRKKGKA